jgi:Interferon-induced transmembrane protein
VSDSGSTPPPDPNEPPRPPEQPGGQPSQPEQPDWSQPSPGQPPYGGQQPYGGQPQYGQPQYGAQPQYGQPYGSPYGQPGGTPPPNYLVWAILTLIFCCWPLSIASIVFAAQVNSKYAAGDLTGAQESSRKAKQFALWSAIAACVIFGLLIALFIVGAVAGSNSNA